MRKKFVFSPVFVVKKISIFSPFQYFIQSWEIFRREMSDIVFQDRNVKLSQKVYYLVNYCVLNFYNDPLTDDRVIVCATSLLIFVNLHSENANFKGKIKAYAPPYPLPP